MTPYFKSGDLLLAFSQEQYYQKEVISFRPDLSSQNIVTHRISQSLNNQFFTKGDANSNLDSQPISHNQIIGAVKLVIPKLGFLIIFLRSKYFSIFIILSIIYFLYKLVANKLSNINRSA
jgi:signal peptidase I